MVVVVIKDAMNFLFIALGSREQAEPEILSKPMDRAGLLQGIRSGVLLEKRDVAIEKVMNPKGFTIHCIITTATWAGEQVDLSLFITLTQT